MRTREDDLFVVRGGDRVAKRSYRFDRDNVVVLSHNIEERDIDFTQADPMTLDRHCILYNSIIKFLLLDSSEVVLIGYRRCFNYPAQSTPVIDQDLLASHLMDKFPVA